MMAASVPIWEEFMIPLLRALNDGQTRSRRDLYTIMETVLELSAEQKTPALASGQHTYQNRIGWALSYLTNIGALERPERAHYVITDAGRWLLEKFPNGAYERDIKPYETDPSAPIRKYVSTPHKPKLPMVTVVDDTAQTPIEQVETGISRINEDVASELLIRLRGKEPEFFEQAVVDLLLAMGYGGTNDAGSITQLTNDGGIDGVIDQDILGLNRVYIQAKRYKEGNTVGRPDLQGFVGALSGKADSGVFITTSRFSEGAKIYAENVPTRIILIDGEKLANLMIRYEVGVQVKETYKVVEIDEDFFA